MEKKSEDSSEKNGNDEHKEKKTFESQKTWA